MEEVISEDFEALNFDQNLEALFLHLYINHFLLVKTVVLSVYLPIHLHVSMQNY